jgi:hypothetical protein
LFKQGKFPEAHKLLLAEPWEDDQKNIVFNLLGNIYIKLQKAHSSHLQYEKSIQSMINPFIPKFGLLKNISKTLLNLGLLTIRQQKYVDGYFLISSACFLSPSLLSQEIILLRLAECCIQSERATKEEKQPQLSAFQRFPITLESISGSSQERFLLK